MTANCKFCDLLEGGVEGYPIFEDEVSYAFLDHRPLFPGHCLLIPRKHYETLADLPETLLKNFFSNVQLLARAMETGLGAEGSFVAINNKVSQSVPHVHVHIVPRRRKDGLRGFFWPRSRYKSAAEMDEIQATLRRALEKLRQ